MTVVSHTKRPPLGAAIAITLVAFLLLTPLMSKVPFSIINIIIMYYSYP